MIKGFKPCLAPNNKGQSNWEERLPYPELFDVSEKLDGIRLEIVFDYNGGCIIYTRNMKPFRSVFIKRLAFQLRGALRNCIVEAEIYCDGMRFNELQHFILSIDVEDHLGRMRRLEDKLKLPFPDRTASWLCRYNHPFTINIFDVHVLPTERWIDRKDRIEDWVYRNLYQRNPMFRRFNHRKLYQLGSIYSWYDSIVNSGGEGLILKHDNHRYKYGRMTLKQGTLFKMKDEYNEYSGYVLDVLQGTMVDPWLETTTNELGYSRTSQRQEDRMPNGKAKGFLVEWIDKHETGKTLTVTLSGFNDQEKATMLKNKNEYKGKIISFVGMKPTKLNGVPRSAKHIKKNG